MFAGLSRLDETRGETEKRAPQAATQTDRQTHNS
jgi:hypothetical protein